MTTIHQMPLFCRWDLLVEFDWRRKLAEEQSLTLRAEGKGTTESIDTAMMFAYLTPLELSTHRHRLLIEESGVVQGTSEKCYCYTAHHEISGDEQLWHMNPGINDRFPDGEIFRCDLILALFACTPEEADRHFRRDFQRIEELIAWQRRRISEFHDGLPGYLEARLKSTISQPRRCN